MKRHPLSNPVAVSLLVSLCCAAGNCQTQCGLEARAPECRQDAGAPLAAKECRLDAGAPWKVHLETGDKKFQSKELEAAQAQYRLALKAVGLDKHSTVDDRVACMQRLVTVLRMEGEFEETLDLDKKSLRLLSRKYGENSAQIVPMLLDLGLLFENEGQYKKASDYFRRAATVAQKTLGPTSLMFSDSQHLLGRALYKLGCSSDAEDEYFSSLSVMFQQPSLPSSTLLDELLADYSDLLLKSENQGKVLVSSFQTELLKDRIGGLRQTQGIPQSNWSKEVIGRTMNAGATRAVNAGATPALRSEQTQSIVTDKPMADFAALQKINQQRIDFYERMIEADIKSLGPEHPSVARDLSGLAAIYLSQNKPEDARTLLEKALSIYRKVYGNDALLTRRTEESLSDLLERQMLPAEAATTDDYFGDLPSIPLEAQKLDVALRLNDIAFLTYSQGKLAKAQKLYQLAFATTYLACGKNNMLVAASLRDYGRVLRSCGRAADAARLEQTAQNIIKRAKQTAAI